MWAEEGGRERRTTRGENGETFVNMGIGSAADNFLLIPNR